MKHSIMDRTYRAKSVAVMLADFTDKRRERDYRAEDRAHVAYAAQLIVELLEETADAILEAPVTDPSPDPSQEGSGRIDLGPRLLRAFKAGMETLPARPGKED